MGKLSILYLGFSMMLISTIQAQESESHQEKTIKHEEAAKGLDYGTAISAYEKQGEITEVGIVKLAEAYRLNHDTENAELWYNQVVETSNVPDHFFYYAQALQSNGKYEMAKEHYLRYNEMVGGAGDNRGAMLAAAIDRMNDWKHSEIEIKNESVLNSEKLDFSPAYYKNGIVFVSSRGVQKGENRKDVWTDDNFMALFFAERDESGQVAAPEIFSINLTSKYHEGPVSFSKNGKRIFFTRNHYNSGKRKNNSKGIMKLQIYTAARDGEEWSNPIELKINTVEHEECHPSVSPDGTKLFFASDRPGGFGGMDIYVSHFRHGEWNEPVNLGSKVNTAGNEVFPFIHDDGTLYFASNGLGGLGGLDIFSTQIGEQEGGWLKAENIGTPFNSPKDDFGFIINVLGTEGYFSSARVSENQDDIFSFMIPKDKEKEEEEEEEMETNFALQDDEGNAIEGVEVSIYEKFPEGVLKESDYNTKARGGMKKGLYVSGQDGNINAKLDPDKDYTVVARKDGHVVQEQEFSTRGKSTKDELNVDLAVPENTCTNLEGVVLDKNKNTIIPYAEVTMVNLSSSNQVAVNADENGKFYFSCVACDAEYILKAERTGFQHATASASTVGAVCARDKSIKVSLRMTPIASMRQELSDAGRYPTEGDMVAGLVPVDEVREGTVIEIPSIYYDFNRAHIRNEDAAKDLDKVIQLLKEYPEMKIELSSHTDSRGSDTYNKKLSKRRADKVVAYLVTEGIDSHRLIAKGYGEEQLRNNCGDGSDCDEAAHQYNRRTEIKILSVGETGVSVRYNDKGPDKIDEAPEWIRNQK